MDEQTERLAQRIVTAYKSTPPDQRLLVGIAGSPGSGKSTLAYPLTDRINALLLHHPPPHPAQVDTHDQVASPSFGAGGGDEVAVCVGMDGWHHSRAEMDKFDDSVEAHWRRGAPFTYDLQSYTAFVSALRAPLSTTSDIPFPTFDHAVKDPAPSPVPIRPSHRIVLIEGLYTLLDRPGWRDAAQMMDVRIYVECDEVVAKERVLRRNFQAGLVDDIDKYRERVEAVDMVNGAEVRNNLIAQTEIVTSVDTPA